jgi:hypothetical protein
VISLKSYVSSVLATGRVVALVRPSREGVVVNTARGDINGGLETVLFCCGGVNVAGRVDVMAQVGSDPIDHRQSKLQCYQVICTQPI